VKPRRIAIIGFGFGGLMVAANLVRNAIAPLELYIVSPDARGLGVAYATMHRGHLLNVPAIRMGAFDDAPDDFYRWLKKQPNHAAFDEHDFVPRAMYGHYLESIWHDTQERALQKKLTIKIVPARATAITHDRGIAVLTDRGDAIAVDAVVLATGHELKPLRPPQVPCVVIQNPWEPDVFAEAGNWPSPVTLVGAGLTAMDVLLSLRAAGYTGEVIMLSRHGLLPQPHATTTPYTLDKDALLAQSRPGNMVRYVRRCIKAHGGDWRGVVDSLRPHTPLLWQRFSARDQQRVLHRLLPYWNSHRHRMPPEAAAQLQAEIAAGTLTLLRDEWKTKPDTPRHVVLNCTGPQLNIAASAQPLLKHIVAHGVIEPHASGLGIAVDPDFRAWGSLYPSLYVIGSLMTGQRFESTAVPELRAQAATIAAHLTR